MNNAPSLRELQQRFAEFVDTGSTEAISSWVVANRIGAAERLHIYRKSISEILLAALRTAFPAVLALVGEPFFAGAAERYRLHYPPPTGNLQDYGYAFAVFLLQMPEADSVPYLPDIAHLEWARQECYLAAEADAELLTPETLPVDQDSIVVLRADVRIVSSAYPLFDIWVYCQEPTEDAPALDTGAQHVLVWREDHQIAMQHVRPEAAEFIRTLRDGATLTRATARFGDTPTPLGTSGFDATECLRWLIGLGLLTLTATRSTTKDIP